MALASSSPSHWDLYLNEGGCLNRAAAPAKSTQALAENGSAGSSITPRFSTNASVTPYPNPQPATPIPKNISPHDEYIPPLCLKRPTTAWRIRSPPQSQFFDVKNQPETECRPCQTRKAESPDTVEGPVSRCRHKRFYNLHVLERRRHLWW